MTLRNPITFGRAIAILLFFLAGMLIFTSFTLGKIKSSDDTDSLPKNPRSQFANKEQSSDIMEQKEKSATLNQNFWRTHNFLQPDLLDTSSLVNLVDIKQINTDIHGHTTFYREASPPSGITPSKQHIVLLHGAAFSSETWENLKTIQVLASLGHHVVAVDLRGFGQSKGTKGKVTDVSKGAFLEQFINLLKLPHYFIVSPSMSGSFMFPFVYTMTNNVRGLITVAPVSSQLLTKYIEEDPNRKSLKIPTLIVYGELDTGLGRSSTRDLKVLENSRTYELPKSSHPAYLDQPTMFHTLVHNFVMEVKIKADKEQVPS